MIEPNKTCHLCDTVLTYEREDGNFVHFTMHTNDFCRDLMASKIRGLEGLVKSKVEECARAEHRARRLMVQLAEEDKL